MNNIEQITIDEPPKPKQKRTRKANKHKKGGRGNKYIPTQQQRLIVSVLLECGIPAQSVRKHRLIDCSKCTFENVYKEEINSCKHIANQEVMMSAYRQAVSGKVPAMTMFWLKCRCGWREKDRDETPANIPELKITIEQETKPA